MNVDLCWKSHPEEWQPLFEAWHAAYPTITRLREWRQRGGARVLGLTVGPVDREEALARPMRLLVAVPHAHEPACTAAAVNAAHLLLTGRYLDGAPATLDVEGIRRRLLVTFLPDTNPQGRARSPQRYWDGRTLDDEAFLKIAFGVAAGGERFGRYPEWSFAEHRPRRIGIVYEQVTEDLWVEPNTSRRSTHSRAIDELFAQFRYTHMLDMHQHQYDETALLPGDFELLAPEAQAAIMNWAHRLIDAWRKAGATPRPEPGIPYRGQARQQYFIDFWRGRCPGMIRLVSEVRNNRHVRSGEPTPPERQLRMASAALEATLALALE